MKSKVVVFLLAVGLLLGRSAFGVTQVITNGNFGVQGLTGWTLSGTTSAIGYAPAGDFFTLGGVTGPLNQPPLVYQTVTIPPNTLYALFSFQLSTVTGGTDPAGNSQFFAFLETPGLQLLSTLDEDVSGNAGPGAAIYNLSNYIGQTIDIAFELQNTNSVPTGSQTFFEVGPVSLLAFTSNDIPANDYFTNSTTLNTASNIVVLGTNVLATAETGEPKFLTGGHSLWWNWTAPANGTVKINTAGGTFAGTKFPTLLGVYTGSSLSSVTQVAANSGASSSSVTIKVTAGTTYHIGVDGKNGALGIIQLILAFATDTTAPTVAISSPASNAKVTNSTVVVKGTANDNIAVASVQYRLGNAQGTNDYQAAVGTNSWTATINNLIPGPNTIQVFALDTSSNASTVVSRTVNFVVVSSLTVDINGTGTVSPNLTNQLQDVGATLTLTAKAGSGQVFSNWVDTNGVQLATTAAYTFTMQTNLVLQANFVPNPFTPVVGDYQGLFYDNTNGPEHASSGFFNVTVASSGSYSAKVIVAGVNYTLSGQFSAGGVATNNLVRKGLTTVSVGMQLDLSGGGITGQLSDGTWTASLNADRGATSATAAKYTMIIPGADVPTTQPGGDGYATVAVSSTGGITLSGALTDGTKVTQKANLLSTGQWAFYVPLYSGKGSIFGWLTFSNAPESDFAGTVDWFKLAGATGKLYPGGFTNSGDVFGSLYQFTNNVPVLNFTNSNNGWFSFLNGNLVSNFVNQVTLTNGSKFINDGTNKLTAAITTTSGLFKVTATDPLTGKSITGNGVVFQKGNFGGGFFLGTNQSGTVGLEPVDLEEANPGTGSPQ